MTGAEFIFHAIEYFFFFSRSYLKLCMFVNVLGPLSAQDELGFIGDPDQVVLHGVTQQPGAEDGCGDAHVRSEKNNVLFNLRGSRFAPPPSYMIKMSRRCLAIS